MDKKRFIRKITCGLCLSAMFMISFLLGRLLNTIHPYQVFILEFTTIVVFFVGYTVITKDAIDSIKE